MGGVPRRSAVSDGSIGPEPSRLRAGAPVPTADGDDDGEYHGQAGDPERDGDQQGV